MAEVDLTIFAEIARFQGEQFVATGKALFESGLFSQGARFIASGSALLVVAQVVEDAAKKEG